jgi:hypothetical protein
LLPGITGALFFLGLPMVIWHWTRPQYFLLFVWMLLTVVLAGMFFNWEHVVPHYVFSLPVFCTVAALPLVEVLRWSSLPSGMVQRGFMVLLVVLITVFAAYQNVKNYFFSYAPKNPRNEFATLGFLTGKLPPDATLYTLGADHYREPHVAKWDMLVERTTPLSILNWGWGMHLLPLRPETTGDAAVACMHRMSGAADVFQRLYPGAESYWLPPRQPANENDEPETKIVYLPRECFLRKQGLKVSLGDGEEQLDLKLPTEPVRNLTAPAGLQAKDAPVWITFSGSLYAPEYGEYLFSFHPTRQTRLEIDGNTVLKTGQEQASVRLAQGLHPVRLTAPFKKPGQRLEWHWKPPSFTRMQEIAPRYFCAWENAPAVRMRGFHESFDLFNEAAWEAEPGWVSIDVLPCIYWVPQVSNVDPPAVLQEPPVSLEWSASLEINQTGQYNLETRGNMLAAVWIDGRLVVPPTNQEKPHRHTTNTRGTVFLEAGAHTLLIRAGREEFNKDNGLCFQLYWQPPGGQWQLLPESIVVEAD